MLREGKVHSLYIRFCWERIAVIQVGGVGPQF